ncbi:MAG: TetR/AcrR family transcriptional regulator, partial [Cyanobacteria bacterium P01_H01_bin.121]
YLCQLEDLFITTLTRAQAAGELAPTADPRNLARLLLCTTQGIALLGRIMDDDPMLAGALTATLAVLDQT